VPTADSFPISAHEKYRIWLSFQAQDVRKDAGVPQFVVFDPRFLAKNRLSLKNFLIRNVLASFIKTASPQRRKRAVHGALFFLTAFIECGSQMRRPEERETRMKTNPVSNDPAGLVAFAQAMATVLSERSDELGISNDVEALLRASIGAATYAMDMYVAVMAGAKKSPEARKFVAEASRRRIRSKKQLRQRVTRSMVQLHRHMRNSDFDEIAYHVASKAS
jgi:hypothetical protein